MNNNITRRTFLKGSVATAVIAAVSGCASQVKGKQDTYLTGLIARMTLEEKVAQLQTVWQQRRTLEDKQLRRAGMDYWQHVKLSEYQNWDNFMENKSFNKSDG